ncbi:MAG: BON domain-containing protein [Proteobacteria bacterium]|nr:BON domain-containing protein [Pseudomonadota bacterium]
MAEPTVSRAAPRVFSALGLLAVFALPACAPTLVSLGADAAYTASEERTTDEVVDDNKIKIELNKLLVDDSLGLWKDVGTVVYRGRVLLIGAVETPEAKAKAGAIGHTPEGVKEVINDIQVTDEGGIGSFINDVAIEKSIQVKYLFDADIDSANFRVRSVNGTVYLIGLAESRAELDKALAIARATGDVKNVVNYMRVQAPKS